MSFQVPLRRLPIRCLSRNPPIPKPSPRLQRRTYADDADSGSRRANPVLDEYYRNNPQALEPEESTPKRPQVPEGMNKPGDIAAGSIFEDERRASAFNAEGGPEGETRVGGRIRDPAVMARTLNPDPRGRAMYERRKVIQMMRKGGRLTKQQFLKRTEREHLNKSHEMKTSVKKLGMLARQIAGKPIDEAIVQMRFSKKKVAQEVLKQLEYARDEAVVMRGMGLGNAAAEDKPTLNSSTANVTGRANADLETAKGTEQQNHRPLEIQLKDGKRHKVTDPSAIYIDQAWVGRGPYGQLPDFRARGKVNILRTPFTTISLKLKEEATRIREYQDREAKRAKKLKEKVWRHLPDRPIQIQRQWYSW